MFARFFKQELMWKWDTNTTPLATNKLHEGNHNSSFSKATRNEFELWPIIKNIIYTNSCHELPWADKRNQEQTRATKNRTKFPGAAQKYRSCQLYTRASRSCQELLGPARSERAAYSYREVPRANQNDQELPRSTQNNEDMWIADQSSRKRQELLKAAHNYPKLPEVPSDTRSCQELPKATKHRCQNTPM